MDRKTETFATDIHNVGKEIEDIKNFQAIGEDSYYVYTNVSSAYTQVLGSTGTIRRTVTFTADHQSNAFAELTVVLYNGSISPGNENKLHFFEVLKKYSTPNTKVTSWEILRYGVPAGTYNIVAYVRSFDSGVVNVS